MIKMTTLIGRDEVVYAVFDTDNYPDLLLWEKRVPLKARGRFKPGGIACSAAAREQEQVAFKHAKEKRQRLENVFPPSTVVLDDRDPHNPVEFTESPAGARARETWAERYDALDGAPESDDDR